MKRDAKSTDEGWPPSRLMDCGVRRTRDVKLLIRLSRGHFDKTKASGSDTFSCAGEYMSTAPPRRVELHTSCLLYTSDAADE